MFVKGEDTQRIGAHRNPEPDRLGRGGLSQHARIVFIDRILGRWDSTPLPEAILELQIAN